MGKSFFIWNGIDCRNMGVDLAGPVAIVRPEERIKHVEIPGRSGDLTYTEGENIFNSYIQTATIQVKGGYHVRDVYRWLRGSGYVTFSGEPDRRQPARIIGAITLNKHSHNIDTWVGECQFYCQPLKELLLESNIDITSSGTSVINTGDVLAKPMLHVKSSGTSLTITATGTGTPAENSITLSSLTADQWIFIDCETMTIWNSDGTIQMTLQGSGSFPVLAPGSNSITGSGWAKIEMNKRERFL